MNKGLIHEIYGINHLSVSHRKFDLLKDEYNFYIRVKIKKESFTVSIHLW